MDFFKKWLASMDTDTLFQMVETLSNTISNLRDKPFCTIRQLEDLQNDLDINRILLKLTFEELHSYDRELTNNEINILNGLLK